LPLKKPERLMSLFEIKCPMCKGSIWIDQSTGKVIDHKSADQQKIDFNSFLKSQDTRVSALEEKARKAKEEAAKRRSEIEQQFKQAKEHPDELKGDVESPFKWD
jgi:Zn-finger nucleic acid-binding protein